MLPAATLTDFTKPLFQPLIGPAHFNVLINGQFAAMPGTITPPHFHGKTLLVGVVTTVVDTTVRVNGMPMRTTGDLLTCGQTIFSKNANVLVGGY